MLAYVESSVVLLIFPNNISIFLRVSVQHTPIISFTRLFIGQNFQQSSARLPTKQKGQIFFLCHLFRANFNQYLQNSNKISPKYLATFESPTRLNYEPTSLHSLLPPTTANKPQRTKHWASAQCTNLPNTPYT